MNKGQFPYEEAAEYKTSTVTYTGWNCKTCGRFWDKDEHMAKWCCAKDLPCDTPECKGRAEKPYIFCKPCLKNKERARWFQLKEVPWDGEAPLCIYDDDKYFYSSAEVEDYLEENDLKLEDICLAICEPAKKPLFDMHALMEDYLCEDQDLDDTEKIESIVNTWIEENVPDVCYPGKTRPTPDSLGLDKEYLES